IRGDTLKKILNLETESPGSRRRHTPRREGQYHRFAWLKNIVLRMSAQDREPGIVALLPKCGDSIQIQSGVGDAEIESYPCDRNDAVRRRRMAGRGELIKADYMLR